MKHQPRLAWTPFTLVVLFYHACSLAAEIQWVDAAVIEKGKKALVGVTTNKTGESAFNGFFASDAGHVVTVAGPLEGAGSVTLHTAAGEKIPAQLLAYDAVSDIAVLVTGRKTPDYLKLSPSPPKVGEPCALVFFENNLKTMVSADGQWLVRRHAPDATHTKFRPVWSVAFSPTLNGGTGSALLCADGTVGGLMQSRKVFGGKTPQVMFLAVPESDVSPFLKASIKAGTPVGFPKLGSINPEVFAMLDPDEQMADACVAKGDLLNAIKGYEKALEKHPRSRTVLGNLAYCLAQTGDHVKARTALEKALKDAPNNVQLRIQLGTLPREDNLDYLKQLTTDAPLFALAWGQLGAFLFNAGRKDEALEALQKYAELEPDSMQAWEGFADALLKMGKLGEARTARARGGAARIPVFQAQIHGTQTELRNQRVLPPDKQRDGRACTPTTRFPFTLTALCNGMR